MKPFDMLTLGATCVGAALLVGTTAPLLSVILILGGTWYFGKGVAEMHLEE